MEFRILELEKHGGKSQFSAVVTHWNPWGYLNHTDVTLTLGYSDLTGLTYNLGIRIFKNSPGDSNGQHSLGNHWFSAPNYRCGNWGSEVTSELPEHTRLMNWLTLNLLLFTCHMDVQKNWCQPYKTPTAPALNPDETAATVLASRERYLALWVILSKILNMNSLWEVTKRSNLERGKMERNNIGIRTRCVILPLDTKSIAVLWCQFPSYKNKRLFAETLWSLKFLCFSGKNTEYLIILLTSILAISI